MKVRKPLVLIPQFFGSLLFDRRNSRYMPFDKESTELLFQLRHENIFEIISPIPDPKEKEALVRFFECYERKGFFDLNGHLATDVLSVDFPNDHLVGPLATHLEIIGACNLKCRHCFAGELPHNHDPLTVREMESLFGELASLGAFRLGLTGGEPLLRHDLFEILDAATEAGLHPCITTNGLLVTREIARELGKRKLVWLNVSVEGPNAAVNDQIRGTGTFDRVHEKLQLLRDHARFTLAFTITSINAHLVKQCAEFAFEVGAHTAVFRPLYPVGIAVHHLDLMPSFEQYTQALRDLSHLQLPGCGLRALDPFSPEIREPRKAGIHTSHTCGAGNHVCSISVQGDVNPCSFLGSHFKGGNIRDRSFREIWNQSQVFRRMRQRENDGFQGGCRARAQVFSGSAFAPDPWFDEHQQSATSSYHPGANLELRKNTISLPLIPNE